MSAVTGPFRHRTRALLAGAAAAVLVVGVVGPAQSQEPVSGAGTSTLSLVPADLVLEGLPADVDTTLGVLAAEATNVEDTLARLRVDGVTAAGQTAPPLDVSSADGDKSGNETREVGAGGVGAALQLLDYAVTAGEGSATSRLAALGAELTTPLGLGTAVDAQELVTAVRPTVTNGGLALSLSGLELGLGDLLPADLLSALPLSVVLDLVDSLGLPLPAGLADQLGDLDALTGTLQDAIDAAGDLDEVQGQLAGLIAELPDLTAAQDAVDAALAEVEQVTAVLEGIDGLAGSTDLLADAQALEDELLAEAALLDTEIAETEALIADLEAEIAGLPLLSPLLDALEVDLADAETLLATLEADAAEIDSTLATLSPAITDLDAALALLDQAQQALTDLLEEVAELNPDLAALLDQLLDLEGFLGGLLDQLTGLLDGLDLEDLRLDLLDELTGTPLLDLGELTIDLATVADGTGGEGTATCAAAGLQVLGQHVPTPSCADVAGALDGLGAGITDALSALPLASALPAVDVGGLDVTSSGTTPAVDGVSSAFARVTALTLDIDSVELTAVTDDLVADLDGLVGELTGLLDGLDLDVLDGLDLDLLDGIDGLDALNAASTGQDAPDVSAAALELPLGLDGALTDLEATLDTLPVGDAPAGLRTLGLEAALGAVDVGSTFTAASAGTPTTPDTPDAPSTPSTPGSPSTPGNLPQTGAGLHLLAMAALAALAAGGVTMMLSRSVAMDLHRMPLRGRTIR